MKKGLMLILFVLPLIGLAQIQTAGYGKQEDFQDIKERPLVVELLDSKCVFADKSKDDLGGFITGYNNSIKYAIENQWKWNKNEPIVYKTTTELDEFLAGNEAKYAVLRFHIETDNMSNSVGKIGTPGYHNFGKGKYKFFQLLYAGADRKINKPDYRGFLPNFADPEVGYTKFDMSIGLKIIQDAMIEILETGKKTWTKKYLSAISKETCKTKANYTLILNRNQIDPDLTESDVRSNYNGDLKIVDNVIDIDYLKNLGSNDVVAVVIPFDVIDASSQGGLISANANIMLYSKILVNAKTLEIVEENGISQVVGPFSPYLVNKDFKGLEKCR